MMFYIKYFIGRLFVGKKGFYSDGYKCLYPECNRIGLTPWQHYVVAGHRKGYDDGNHPTDDVFFGEGYEIEYPEVNETGADPWRHYAELGCSEGRDNGLHPDEKTFFAAGYLEMYPDVAKAKVDPWHHYVLSGKKEGRDNGLHPDEKTFFAAGYLEMYPDVAKAKVDPWHHYVLSGKKEGRDNGLNPNDKTFFAAGYLEMYPDIARANIDPWHHYVLSGKKAGFDNGLNPDGKIFLADPYLRMYPDVAKAKIDPWRHYVLSGKKEGRCRARISTFENYTRWVFDLNSNKDFFIPDDGRLHRRKQKEPKIFAYYLPQFHAIPLNDRNYGKGFTEWTNVARSTPIFYGQYQPRVPYDLGFYNLDHAEILERQVELAKQYGIYGFCFYYYWFSGNKVLDKPLRLFLNSKLNFKFHLMWANENWSKLWDGGNKEVILEQKLDLTMVDHFYKDLLPYIKDRRYEKINNKPIFAVYRPSMFDEELFCAFLNRLNTLARADGFNGFYFLGTNFNSFHEPEKFGLEGIIEFPPHGLWGIQTVSDIELFNLNANVRIFDLHKWVMNESFLEDRPFKLFKCCFPHWDNSPRKTYSNGAVFHMEDGDFYKWLTGIIDWTKEHHSSDEQYIYINAWNEWGEGAYLEPDLRYGYESLSYVRKALEDN